MHRTLLRIVLVLPMLAVLMPAPTVADTALWQALRQPGHFALLRHAIAPGTGDPDTFTLGDCNTQRTLSAAGRDQARRIGARLRANGVTAATVYTSQWCRCRETAVLLGFAAVEDLPILNSFFRNNERRDPQTRALRTWIIEHKFEEPVVLVTHQVNITALTGIYPKSGELVIVRRSDAGELSIVGTVETE